MLYKQNMYKTKLGFAKSRRTGIQAKIYCSPWSDIYTNKNHGKVYYREATMCVFAPHNTDTHTLEFNVRARVNVAVA